MLKLHTIPLNVYIYREWASLLRRFSEWRNGQISAFTVSASCRLFTRVRRIGFTDCQEFRDIAPRKLRRRRMAILNSNWNVCRSVLVNSSPTPSSYMMGVKGEKWIVGMPINVLVSNEIGKGNDKQMRKTREPRSKEKYRFSHPLEKRCIFKGLLRY